MASAKFTEATNFIKELSAQANVDKGNENGLVDDRSLLAWLATLENTSTLLGQQLQQQVAHHASQSFIPSYNYNEQIHQRGARQLEDAFLSSKSYLGTATHLKDQATIASSDTHNLETQTRQSHAIVTTLKKLVKIAKKLDQVDTFLGKGALVDSTRQLLAVLDELANDDDEGDLRVKYQLQTRAERYKTLLANTIHDGLTQGITTIEYTQGDSKILELKIQQSVPFTHETTPTTLHMKDLLLASAMLQTQHVELTSIKRRLIKQFAGPFLSDFEQQWKHDLIRLDINETNDSATIRLDISPLLPKHNEEEGCESHHGKCNFAHSMMDRSTILVKVLFDHLFGKEEYWTALRQLFGRLFLPDVFNLLITTTIAPTVPSTFTSTDLLDNLTSLASSVASFERQCIVDYAAIASYESRTTSTMESDFPLTLYVSHFDQHVAHKRRSRLLHDARSLILRRIYDAEPVSSDGPSITQTPRLLCAMIQDITAEVGALEQQEHYKQHYSTTILTLHKTIHDILILYMSIMPSVHRTTFLQYSDRAIVFRNDCFWLANQQQTRQPESVVNKLRQLGDFWQTIVISQLMISVGAILDKTSEWQQEKSDSMIVDTKQLSHSPSVKHQSLHSQPQGTTLENAITIIVAKLHGLAKTIRPVMSADIYQHVLIQVVDSIVGRLAGDILSMSDISADESHTMAQALNGVAQLANVFISDKGDDVISEFTLRQWIPRWQGFWMVKEMLDMTMADILATLQRGELSMFTHSELVHLVCALFADTPRRDETLQIIKSSDLNGIDVPPTTATSELIATHSPIIPSSASSPEEQHLDRGMASTDRFAFEMDGVDGDGWNQDGWSDDDDTQLDIGTNPPLHNKDDMIQSVIKASPSNVNTVASSDPITTSSPALSPLSMHQEQEKNHGAVSRDRFAFEMDEVDDDGWNQDGWLDDDAQMDFKIDIPLENNTSLLNTDENVEQQDNVNQEEANAPVDTSLPDHLQADKDKDRVATSWPGDDYDHQMEDQGLPDKATTDDPMDYLISGTGTAVDDLDMGDEGSGWSDADHDIDIDGLLMSNSLLQPTNVTDPVSHVPFIPTNDYGSTESAPPTEDSASTPAQSPPEKMSPPSARSPVGTSTSVTDPSPPENISPSYAQSPVGTSSPISAQSPIRNMSPLSAESPTRNSTLASVQPPHENMSPPSAQSPIEISSPSSAHSRTGKSTLVSAQSPHGNTSPPFAQSPVGISSPLPTQSPFKAPSPSPVQSPLSVTSTDSVHQQQDITMAETTSKPTSLEDILNQSNCENEDEGGGWSDAENLMEFDDPTLSPLKETTVPDGNPTGKTLQNTEDDDTLLATPEKEKQKVILPTGSTLVMDPLFDDDDTGGGWSDADEDLFFK